MPNIFRSSFLAATAISLGLAPVTVSAQAVIETFYTVVVPSGEFGSAAFTAQLVSGIAAAKKFCSDLEEDAYRVDCLAERLGAVSDGIPEGTDYDEVRTVLETASGDMEKLAQANRDPDLPRARASRVTAPNDRTTRPLTPVAKPARAATGQQAIAILEQAQTQLLRSSEVSKTRSIQYAQIAQAMDSTKVLLRS